LSEALTAQIGELMREASRRAILPRWRKLAGHEVEEKQSGGALPDVVTIADREAEAILTEGLALILPEAAVVGEEAVHADSSVLDRLGDQLCWIVDPLDGTNNFAIGRPPFGVTIALAERGETVAGWIYDPLGDRLCHAYLGRGAFIGDERIAAKATGTHPPVAANSLIYMRPERRQAVRAAIEPHYTLVDIPRCAAEQYPRLVLGTNDVAIFERTLPWDHAAGALFVNEAGGKVARPDGRPYRVDEHHRNGLIGAASERLWDRLAALLPPGD
jgi:fructose-1,6-bisphosphatase/inositol monophosphatase family enzyme